MAKPAKYASLLAAVNNKNAIVLPAFETADSGDIGVEVAREVVLGERSAAQRRQQGGGAGRGGCWPQHRALQGCAIMASPGPNPRACPACPARKHLPHIHTPRLAEGKELASPMYWDGRIKAFHTDRYSAGHRATDYAKWATAVKPYRIRYEEASGRALCACCAWPALRLLRT